jgi:flagellar hook-associated protein 3 FlgL
MSRVTNTSTTQLMLRDIQTAQQALTRSQSEIASNKRVQIASDDPGAALASLANRAELRRNDQLGRNADRATEWLNAADRATTSAVDLLTQARGLLIQATSGATDDSARLAIANQLRQIRESLLSTANTQVAGRALFGGTAAGAAYDDTGAYTGDAGAVSTPVAAGITMQVSRNGTDVFGTADATDPANGDIFQVLSSLADAVQNRDTAAVQAGLGKLDTATTRVQDVQTELGSRLAQLQDLRTTATARAQDLTSQISELEDVDLAEATITMKAKELAYQSALGVAGRILQTTLLDFLR